MTRRAATARFYPRNGPYGRKSYITAGTATLAKTLGALTLNGHGTTSGTVNSAPVWGQVLSPVPTLTIEAGGTLNLHNSLYFSDPDVADTLLIYPSAFNSYPALVTYDRLTGILSASALATATTSGTLTFTADDQHASIKTVGPGKQYATIAAANAAANHSDIIEVDAGVYTGDVCTITKNNLTIRGVGGRASIYANGLVSGGKGIWNVSSAGVFNFTCENIDFHDARVGGSDHNAGGIRGDCYGTLTISDCGFYDCENGILTGGQANTVLIERCEFARCGYGGSGFEHNLYLGQHQSVTLRDCYSHECDVGHTFKSRARFTTLERCYFVQGSSTSSYVVNCDSGGTLVMRGCMLQKSFDSGNDNGSNGQATFMYHQYYTTAGTWPEPNTILAEHCTFVNNYTSTAHGPRSFFAAGIATTVTARGCIFASNGVALAGVNTTVVQDTNYITTTDNFANAYTDLTDPDFWPDVDILPPLTLTTPLVPTYLLDEPHVYTPRTVTSPLMIGALQAAP